MNYSPKPDTDTASFADGPLTARLSFPAEDAPSWVSATPAAILGHLGLAILVDPVGAQQNGTDAARQEPGLR